MWKNTRSSAKSSGAWLTTEPCSQSPSSTTPSLATALPLVIQAWFPLHPSSVLSLCLCLTRLLFVIKPPKPKRNFSSLYQERGRQTSRLISNTSTSQVTFCIPIPLPESHRVTGCCRLLLNVYVLTALSAYADAVRLCAAVISRRASINI